MMLPASIFSDTNLTTSLSGLGVRRVTLFVFELFECLKGFLRVGFAPGCRVSAAKLIMYVRLVRPKPRSSLKAFDGPFDIASLKQGLPKLEPCVGKIRLERDHLGHQFHGPVGSPA